VRIITKEELEEIQEKRDIMKKIRELAKGKDPVKFVEALVEERDRLKAKISEYDNKENRDIGTN